MKKCFCLSLVLLSTFFVVGCNNQNGVDNAASNETNDDDSYIFEENQSLYNRIILDYYEQRLCKSGFVTEEENNCIINIINDGKTWSKINSRLGGPREVDASRVAVSEIHLVIDKKSDKGAFVCSFDSVICQFAYLGYTSMRDTISSYVNGQKCIFGQSNLPMVWYQGLILDVCEAFELDLIEIEDLNDIDLNYSLSVDNSKIHHYDETSSTLTINRQYSPNNAYFSELKNDYFNYCTLNNLSTIDGRDLTVTDIHVFDIYLRTTNMSMLTVACDNMYAPSEIWSKNIVCGDFAIEPFNLYEPILYINHGFYSIGAAYDAGFIKTSDILTIKESFN